MNGEPLDDILDIYESQYARDLEGRLIRAEKATLAELEQLIKIVLDGQEVEMPLALPTTDDQGILLRGPDGRLIPRRTTILDAALKRYETPRRCPIAVLCHQEHLKPVGVCRVCCVLTVRDREPSPRLAPACVHPLVKGMEVHTRASTATFQFPGQVRAGTAKDHLTGIIQGLVQLLALRHVHQAEPTNNRRYHNELLALCEEYDVPVASSGRSLELNPSPLQRAASHLENSDASSPIITLNRDQCILCDRCVRSCSDVKPFKIIGHTGFGHGARISFDLDRPMGASACKACGECAIACPTGALTFKGTVYQDRDPWRDLPAPHPKTVVAEELATMPLFAGVPYAFLKWNEGAVGRMKCQPGQILCHEGEYGATAFIIEEGSVELLLGKGLRSIGTRTAADLILGEMACMTNQPRTATLRAQAGAQVLVVRRNMLHMLQRNRAARAILFPLYRQRAIDTYLLRGQLFAGLTDEQNQRCVAFLRDRSEDIEFLQVDPGQTILRQGDPADSFYIIYLGHVKVSERTPGGLETVMDYLGPGRHFGEIGLMTSLFADVAALVLPDAVGRRTASCAALDHVELVCIGARAFRELLENEPEIASRLKERCRRVLEKNRGLRKRFDHDLDEFTSDGLYQGQNLLVIDLEKCTRCQECVKACSVSHGGVTRLLLEGNRFDHWLVPSACRSCHDPACLVGCPVDAIHRRPPHEGGGSDVSLAVVIEDHCIGCGLCAHNCPYGSIHMLRRPGKSPLATNCDLCESLDGKPRCVYQCPHDAALRLDGRQFALRLGLHPMDAAKEQRP
jgi:Fe-S-cluster-containing hydrogenase component 2